MIPHKFTLISDLEPAELQTLNEIIEQGVEAADIVRIFNLSPATLQRFVYAKIKRDNMVYDVPGLFSLNSAVKNVIYTNGRMVLGKVHIPHSQRDLFSQISDRTEFEASVIRSPKTNRICIVLTPKG